MRTLPILLLLTALLTFALACGEPPMVVQGTVVSYDAATKHMVLRDEAEPGGTLELSLQDAEIGADCLPGDTVRIAYRQSEGKLTATRVMNITRQEEIGKKDIH